MHPGDLAGGFSDLEITWLLYCAGAATGHLTFDLRHKVDASALGLC